MIPPIVVRSTKAGESATFLSLKNGGLAFAFEARSTKYLGIFSAKKLKPLKRCLSLASLENLRESST